MNYEDGVRIERNKRKHITLTIREKLDIINLIDSGQSRQSIATRYGVGKTTVHDIYKRKDKLQNFATQKTSDLAKRRRLDVSLEEKHFVKTEEFDYKEIVEEETLVENFDHEEFDYANDQEYEIVYEPALVDTTNELLQKAAANELPKLGASSGKRKSKTLTLKEKYDVLKQLEAGESVPKICQKYEIGRTTVYDFIKNKEKIFEYIEKSSDENRKTFKKSNYPEIENKMKEWCRSNQAFTKQQFFDKCKQYFAQMKQPNSTQFCGSWSWCKRFFERYPEFKRKIISARGEQLLLDSSDLSSHPSKSFVDDMDSIYGNANYEAHASSSNRRQAKYLNLSEKLQVLDDLAEGLAIVSVADKWNVSKSTIYDILKRQEELQQLSQAKINSERKVIKSPKYPEFENALLQWCLSQDVLPTNALLQNKALYFFNLYKVGGSFNITTLWMKKFLQRYPEISERFEHQKKSDYSADDIIVEDESGNSLDIESLEFIDSEFLPMENEDEEQNDDDDEYIVEELEHDNANDGEFVKYELVQNEESYETINEEISDEEAMKSLKVLIKYSAKKGHSDISNLLIEYQNILKEEIP